METFLHDLSIERRWSILLLQEASYRRAVHQHIQHTGEGHLVLAMEPHVGQRAGAIVIQ